MRKAFELFTYPPQVCLWLKHIIENFGVHGLTSSAFKDDRNDWSMDTLGRETRILKSKNLKFNNKNIYQ